MSTNLANSAFTKIYQGSTEVKKIVLGTVQVYPPLELLITGTFFGTGEENLIISDNVGNVISTFDISTNVNAVAFDLDRNFYSNISNGIRKYNPAGNTIWSVTGIGESRSLVVDTSGNVYTGGLRVSNNTTRKYNSAGTLQWSADHGDNVFGIAVDPSGNVYTGGNRNNNISPFAFRTTRKYNSAGVLQWSVDHGDSVSAIAVDQSGNVYTGAIAASNNLRKYTTGSTLLWTATHGSTVFGIAVDPSGNVYIGGARSVATDNFTTRKYNSSGTLQWSRDHGDNVFGIAVDKAGNIYTVGPVVSGITTRKYNSAGTLLESWSVNFAANDIDTFPPNRGTFLG